MWRSVPDPDSASRRCVRHRGWRFRVCRNRTSRARSVSAPVRCRRPPFPGIRWRNRRAGSRSGGAPLPARLNLRRPIDVCRGAGPGCRAFEPDPSPLFPNDGPHPGGRGATTRPSRSGCAGQACATGHRARQGRVQPSPARGSARPLRHHCGAMVPTARNAPTLTLRSRSRRRSTGELPEARPRRRRRPRDRRCAPPRSGSPRAAAPASP